MRKGTDRVASRARLAPYVLIIMTLCLAIDPAAAAEEPAGLGSTVGDNQDIACDELMLFQEIPPVVVVSASRQAAPMDWLSVPATVITAEDIHYSGKRNVAEVLRFAPGLDVLRIDRNTYAVGIRGHHGFYADRLLTMIDGRSVNNAAFGGVEWTRLPVLMEDIKSIEIARGPASAAWGASALTGVINIITKDPEECLGLFAATTWNDLGEPYSHVRYAAREGKWSYRLSVGRQNHKSSEDAIHDDGFDSRDFARNWVMDAKVLYRPCDATKVTMGGAYMHEESADFGMLGYWPRKRAWYDVARPFVRIDHKFDDDASGYIQWFSEYADSRRPQFLDKTWYLENDLEGQLNFRVGDSHRVSAGAITRWTHFEYDASNINHVFMVDEPLEEYSAGAFAMDRWQVTDRFVLEGQLRSDWHSEVQTDWAGRITALYALDADKKHIVRIGGAKAFRSPAYAIREGTMTRYPLPSPPAPPGFFGYNLIKPDPVNEETWSIEAGYSGKLTEHLTVRIDPYYQRFERLVGVKMLNDPLGMGRTMVATDNVDGADAFGTECELALTGKRGKLSAWYAYNYLRMDRPGQHMRAYRPARNKAGLTGRLNLGDGWMLSSSYRYTDMTIGEVGDPRVGRSHRLDFALAKEILEGHGEIMIGVDDVLNTTEGTASEGGAVTASETPGRTFFVRLQVSF